MIKLREASTALAGTNWVQSNKTNDVLTTLCITSTGRIIAGVAGNGIWYSDDNGVNWTRSSKTSGQCESLGITSTGRIIAGFSGGVWYSDNNGVNWTKLGTSSTYSHVLCVTPTGRIITSMSVIISGNVVDMGFSYSDDNGVNWVQSNKTNGSWWCLCVISTGRIIAGSNSNGIWYSDPEIITAKNAREKYLDQNGAQEIVTQFKAYCDSLVGGA